PESRRPRPPKPQPACPPRAASRKPPRPASTRALPPPLWGRVGEGGTPQRQRLRFPPPLTSPHKGEGNGDRSPLFVSRARCLRARRQAKAWATASTPFLRARTSAP